MQIGTVGKRVGLSVDAIRFYERNALLPRPPRTQGGFRQYAETDVETLAFIRRVQGLGFKLSVIRGLLNLRGSRLQPCAPVRRRLEEKLSDVQRKLADLQKLEHELRMALRSCNKELRNRPAHWELEVDLERAKARVKVLAASSPGEYIIVSQQTGEKISIRPPAKRILFQVGYEEKGLNARVELLRRFGHEVISVTHNEAAKVALSSFRNVDFIVDYAARERTRKEMVGWLKANYPKVKIIALNPSKDQLIGADYNVVLNDHDEWLSLLAAAAG